MDISAHEEGFSKMQEVKRRFFALRNGIISDTLRRAGSPFKVIFGLNLPQLKEIADFTGKDRELAEALRANDTTRESLLLAPLIYPGNELTEEEARRWLADCPTEEVSDMLCHGLLRHCSFAPEVAFGMLEKKDATDMEVYGALRLIMNLLRGLPAEKCRAAVNAADARTPAIQRLKSQIIDELDFLEDTPQN